MYILILIISLKSQFNHALDVKIQDNIATERICHNIGEKTITELKNFNKDVDAKYLCETNAVLSR